MVWLDDYEMNLFLKAAGTVWHLCLKTFFFFSFGKYIIWEHCGHQWRFENRDRR